MRTRNHRPFTYVRVLALISIFMIAVAALAVPFYSVRSEALPGGKSEVVVAPKVSTNIRSVNSLVWTPTVNMPLVDLHQGHAAGICPLAGNADAAKNRTRKVQPALGA